MNTKKLSIFSLLLVLVLSLFPVSIAEETNNTNESNQTGWPIKYGECGDGVCDNGENTSTYPYYCPQDCDSEDENDQTLVSNTVDDSTNREIAIMDNGRGAEIRLLQLEKAIVRRIAIGELVVAAFDSIGQDTTELSTILDSLEELRIKVSETDPTAEDRVEQFVSLKAEAIELIKSFKDIAHTMKDSLSEEQLEELRTAFKEINEDRKPELETIKAKIRERIRFHNAEKVKEFLGEDAKDLAQRIQNGEITKDQIRAELRNSFSKLSEDQKKGIYDKALQANVDRIAAKRIAVNKIAQRLDAEKLRVLKQEN